MPTVVETRAPGVYLEEVRRRPAPALETGVPAFLGRLAAEAPAAISGGGRAPVALDAAAWSALEGERGAAWAEGYLGFAVRGFFENGGRRCYVAPFGEGGVDAALEALDPLDDFDLVCAPDAAPRLPSSGEAPLVPPEARGAIVRFCDRRLGRFAVLDAVGAGLAPAGFDAAGLAASAEAQPPSVNAALYGPWVKVRGACPTCRGGGRDGGQVCGRGSKPGCLGSGQGFVPPSGHVAGLYARTDRETGPHRAPANAPLAGALDLELYLDAAASAQLNLAGVNALRALPGRGIRVWGARTLRPDDPDFAHVSSRRLVLTAARWLEQAMADLAFEANDLRLWTRVGRDVGAFLDELVRRGALAGASAAEAYYVKCDAETNPPALRELGQLSAEIGLALAKPNEFVVVRLLSDAPGASPAAPPAAP
jgi:Bacteriophage tail sheath protein